MSDIAKITVGVNEYNELMSMQHMNGPSGEVFYGGDRMNDVNSIGDWTLEKNVIDPRLVYGVCQVFELCTELSKMLAAIHGLNFSECSADDLSDSFELNEDLKKVMRLVEIYRLNVLSDDVE